MINRHYYLSLQNTCLWLLLPAINSGPDAMKFAVVQSVGNGSIAVLQCRRRLTIQRVLSTTTCDRQTVSVDFTANRFVFNNCIRLRPH